MDIILAIIAIIVFAWIVKNLLWVILAVVLASCVIWAIRKLNNGRN